MGRSTWMTRMILIDCDLKSAKFLPTFGRRRKNWGANTRSIERTSLVFFVVFFVDNRVNRGNESAVAAAAAADEKEAASAAEEAAKMSSTWTPLHLSQAS